MRRGAIFDTNQTYRYRLFREWGNGAGRVCFVMLNPSRADAESDDPTTRRCIGFARSWGYCALDVVNLFAYRTESPRRLRQAAEPIGPENDDHLRRAVEDAALTVAAWGNHGTYRQRHDAVMPFLRSAMCLGQNRSGQPRHPLYVRNDSVLEPLCV